MGTALLLIDVINDLAFPGSEALIAQAKPMAQRLAALKRRAADAGVPVNYVNDKWGWDLFNLVEGSMSTRCVPGIISTRRAVDHGLQAGCLSLPPLARLA